ncbi:MAG: hypothetical protein WC310_04675 [Patescibacteria group bacterium]|jgi:SAM-dependent methyltransferase
MNINFETIDLIIVLIVLAFIITFLISYKRFSPWIPTDKKDWQRIFALAEFKDCDVFYDLGCGAGALVFEVNKRFGIKTVGIEVSLFMYLICRIRQIFHPSENLFFRRDNFFHVDLSEATVVYFFGIPTNLENNELPEKLRKELKPGTRVISYAFAIPGWTPTSIDRQSPDGVSIIIYKL